MQGAQPLHKVQYKGVNGGKRETGKHPRGGSRSKRVEVEVVEVEVEV